MPPKYPSLNNHCVSAFFQVKVVFSEKMNNFFQPLSCTSAFPLGPPWCSGRVSERFLLYKCGLGTRSVGITWELFQRHQLLDPIPDLLNQKLRVTDGLWSVFYNPPRDSDFLCSLRTAASVGEHSWVLSLGCTVPFPG